MNRAFVTENDGWNYCASRSRYCKDASMRGKCERITCKYGPESGDDRNEETRDSKAGSLQ